MGRGEKEDTAGHDPADEYLAAAKHPLCNRIGDSDRRDRWLKILLGDRMQPVQRLNLASYMGGEGGIIAPPSVLSVDGHSVATIHSMD